MSHILIIDDEADICRLVERALQKDGYDVTSKNSASGLTAKDFKPYDLVLLDVMMPDTDGFSLCRQIRRDVDCPILFLTAKTMEEDLVEGFALGADDYIKKPFSLSELRARVAAHIRRENRERHQVLALGGYRFDLSARALSVNNQIISLTKSEYSICEFLGRNKGQVFSLEQILEAIWGYDVASDITAVRMHIKNIRGKLAEYGDNPIETVWGVGYKWK